MKTRFSSPNLRNMIPGQGKPREPVDKQSRTGEGFGDAGQYQNIQQPSRREVSLTGDEPATPSGSGNELEQQQDPSGSAPQSPTEYYDTLEDQNAEQQSSNSTSGDTDFLTPAQSPTKLVSVPVQRQQQQQRGSEHPNNGSQEPSSSHAPPQIRVEPPSPQVVTSAGADSEDEADNEQGVSLRRPGVVARSRSGSLPPPLTMTLPEVPFHRSSSSSQLELLPTSSYSPTTELQADLQEQQLPPASPASPQGESGLHTVSSPLRLLLKPLKTPEQAVMSQPTNSNPPAADQGQHASSHVDNNPQTANNNNTMPQNAGAPQTSLTEEQVRALMMEDDDFDPIPEEYRQQPASAYTPQTTASSSTPQYAQAYNSPAPYIAGPQFYDHGMAIPYQYGPPPPQQYAGAPYGYGFPQQYPGYNNPLFADPRLAYTPPVGPRAQMAGPINTPPVGLPAQLAHPTGVLPYTQSPGGRDGVGGTPSPHRQGQAQGQDSAGSRMDGEDGDEDVVGGVPLRDNGNNN
ncbi:hypothetical protein EDD37DRAFT_607282 [Exophiala viscosa]|uniref:Uncharacterized protein n=1 Tax=Exophiala viscosa TaxID=2486360 RepID=A0AAN6DWA0_9EURO|nr:hypothetical protein EDD36DRAFT_464777 [Exophiala viscosa]KAI1625691.1 hypothetical protein EDD37DRAFT_607282 [Exophiala viscosa]